MKTKLLTSVACAAMMVAGTASAYTISDTYYGSNDHGLGDRIGSSTFEVHGMDVSFAGGFMDVTVYTNYINGTLSTTFGDLFISTNGWAPFGSAPYLSDNASNGEVWEFVFDTSANKLVGGAFGTVLSSGPSGSTWRDGQEVLRAGGTGSEFSDGSSVDLTGACPGSGCGSIKYHINMASLGYDSINDPGIGLHWAMTCANDVIEGGVKVPEPGTLALLGLSLVGISAARISRKARS